MSSVDAVLPDGYARFLTDLKDQVRSAWVRAQRMVNGSLIGLDWTIGERILAEQERQGWDSAMITRLAADLRREFPEMTGLSRSNLQCMRAFAAACPNLNPDVPQPVGHLPWGYIRILLDRDLTPEVRYWYAAAAVEHGWSRNVLLNMIMNQTLGRTGAALRASPSHAMIFPAS